MPFSGSDSWSLKVDQDRDWVIQLRIEILDMADHLSVALVITVRHIEPCHVHTSSCECFNTFR